MKTVSDLYLPLSGKVVEFNEELESEPELVNTDPYGKGWIIKVRNSRRYRSVRTSFCRPI